METEISGAAIFKTDDVNNLSMANANGKKVTVYFSKYFSFVYRGYQPR